MTTVNNTYNCTQLVLHRVISMAKLYNFDDATMMDHYGVLLIKITNAATIYHAHGLTITITKQCGGTPVSFASVLFNLEHKQEKSEITLFRFTFRYCHFFAC